MQTLRIDADVRRSPSGDKCDSTEVGAAGAHSQTKLSQIAPTSTPLTAASQAELAVRDVIQGARVHYLWGLLGWQDIRRRYRRSVLGPFWLTISMGILVAALGTLYGALLKVDISSYIPHLALGFIVWAQISGLITEGCRVFTNAEGIIKQTDLPVSIHVYRMVWRNLLTFFHNAAIFVVVAVIFSIWPGWTGLLALPGLLLLCLNGVWAGFVLGIVSARYRDVPPIVASVVRIAFFVTPIIWMPELVPGRAVVLEFNPFFHVLELVRAPLLGQVPALASWLVVSGIALGGCLATFTLLRRYRRRIAYWV